MSWNKLLVGLVVVLIGVNVFIAAWLPLHGDIHYFSDNARDMLLLHEIVHVKPITLIGPRSGISGVFHGPLWLYMNLPVFYMSGGNPATLGWFWFFLFLVNTWVVYMVGKRLFGKDGKLAGLTAALLFSFAFYSTGWSQFNANGVLLVMPIFMWTILDYLEGRSWKSAVLLFFLIGLLIQFQIAFGLPMLILTGLLFCWDVWKSKKWKHMFAPLVLLIPTATEILFDLRHDFIQLKSLIAYAGKSEGQPFLLFVQERLLFGLREFTNWIPNYSMWVSVVLIGLLILAIYKTKNAKLRTLAFLYAYFYIGFWAITLGYKGTMWPYYYWGLIPCLFVLIGGIVADLPQKTRVAVIATFALVLILFQARWFIYQREHVLAPRPISWKFHNDSVEKIYENAPAEFGYYVFSDDLFGYQTKYAFVYGASRHEEKHGTLNTKKTVTYTYMMPTASTDLTWEGWLEHQVKITREPNSIQSYPNGVAVYKYDLSEVEQAVPSDPYLLDSLMFR